LLIFARTAASQKNSGSINFLRQFIEDGAQPFPRNQAKIRWRQSPLVENRPLRAGVSALGYTSFNKHPCGFCAASFDPEDTFAGFHSSVL
jgi:hypothetical protein